MKILIELQLDVEKIEFVIKTYEETNLKMLDYMSMGIPIMITEFRTRGIDLISYMLRNIS